MAVIPSAVELGGFMRSLTHRPVTASSGRAAPESPSDLVGVYVYDDGRIAALSVATLAAAAHSAAALAAIPQGGIEDAVKDGELYELMADAYHEVANVCAQLIQGDGAHIALTIVAPRVALPEDAARVLGTPSARGDYELAFNHGEIVGFSILEA